MNKFTFRSAVLVVFLLAVSGAAQRPHGIRPTDSGGRLLFEQAVYDVKSYDIDLKVDPKGRSISGISKMKATAVIPTNVIALDLDTPYVVQAVTSGEALGYKPLRFERREGRIWVWFPQTKQPGDQLEVAVTYAGVPRVAPNAPWVGGFVWEKTASGADWIGVALQNDGADLLFPCKDHPSDKPSSVVMRVTVPDPLIAVGPGKLAATTKNADGTSTFEWRMGQPISNYSIVFQAAPYKLVEDTYRSVAGTTVPINFYVLPESQPKAASLIAEEKKYLAFFEKYLGPYPFRTEKAGIVETPYLGMEHATSIAYGNKFNYAPDGTDWLLLHELGHEWWANLVTASDWRDFWIHEGLQSYMDVLYQEHLHGKAAYIKAMARMSGGFRNTQAVAPRDPKLTYQVYMAGPDYMESDPDIYTKGAAILHSLRYVIGDDAFFRTLRRMAYPTKESESYTDGRQIRLVTTDDLLSIAEDESKMELDWFFEVYLRQPKLPKLVTVVAGNTLELKWEAPAGLAFPMPVDVVVDGKSRRIEMEGGKASVPFSGAAPTADPDGWVLREVTTPPNVRSGSRAN